MAAKEPLVSAGRADFDEYAADYAQEVEAAVAFSGKDHDFYLRAKAEYLTAALRRRGVRPAECAVLDVGCGSGALHRHLRAYGSVTGVDESAAMLERARVEHPAVSYLRSDARPLPLRDERFDVVLAVNLLHHVRPATRPALVRELTRVCRTGGLIAVIEHNPLHPLTRYVVARCRCDRDARLLGGREVTGLLERCEGVAEVELGYLLLAPSERRLVRRLEHALRRFPFGAQYCAIGRRTERHHAKDQVPGVAAWRASRRRSSKWRS